MSEWKKTEIEQIPKGWSIYPLEEFVVKERGISYGIVQPGFHYEEGIPVIRVNNIKDGRIILDEVLKVHPDIAAKYKRTSLLGDELLITLVGNLGEVVLVDKFFENWNVARAVGVIPLKQNINKLWVRYWLSSKHVKHYIQSHANTTVQATLNLKDVAKLPILFPPLSQQLQIVNILSTLDAKIDLLRRQNQTLEQIAHTLFKRWFVEFEFPNDEGQPYKSCGGAMVESELGEIPQGWRVVRYKAIVELTTGKGLNRTDFKADGTYPVLGANGEMGRTDKYLTDENLIVTGRVGTLGVVRLIRGKVWISDNVLISKPTSKFFYYIYFTLKRVDFQKLNRGSTQPLITQGDVNSIEVLIPSDHLLVQYQSFTTPIYHKVEVNENQVQTLTHIRDTLLPKLLSGKLRVAAP